MHEQEKISSVERAYRALRQMAILFELKPGERLNEVEIARRLTMSRAPVREAMNRLVSEGLLKVQPNHGFFCRQLSASEASALYELRADLEAGGVRKIAERMDSASLAEVATFWKQVMTRADELTVEALVAHDEAFHLAIARLSGNQERVHMLENINARIYFVRRINLEQPTRRQETFAEHEALVAALVAGDGPQAERVLRRHLALSAHEALDTVSVGLARIYADQLS